MEEKEMGLFGTAQQSVTGLAILDTIPNVTNNSAVSSIKSKTAVGVSEIGNTFPTQGKILATSMTFKQLKKINKNIF